MKQLIGPRLGNQVFLASQLLQSPPALQRNNKHQIAALPLGARVKLDPYSDRHSNEHQGSGTQFGSGENVV